jgi:glycosyltransferase involved in cell wall biosynthesis
MYAASLIVPIRVGHKAFACYLTNLAYCLTSAKNQTIDYEFILVDYGSIPPYPEKIKKLAKQFKVKYVRGEGPIWSRSRSINLGIKYAKGARILFIDSDCVIPANYVEKHVAVGNTEKIFTHSPVYDTVKGVVRSHKIPHLAKYAQKNVRPGGISHMGVSRKWLLSHGGFNDEYKGWGGEDNDIWLRLRTSGVRPVLVPTYPYHLWHPTYEALMHSIGKGALFKSLRQKNRNRYHTLKNKLLGKK